MNGGIVMKLIYN